MRTSRAFRASRARPTVLFLIFSLTLVLGLIPAAAAAAVQPPKPSSMAATGDSITRAFNLCFFPFSDCPAQSWATGTNSTVNSHARRLKITGSAFNDAKSGAKMSDLETQAATVATRNVGYLTVLMGGNDVCTDSEGLMTTPDMYEAQFRNAMNKLKVASPPLVYVVSVPNVKMLWEILKDNSSARSAWNSYNVCQSLLANPLSNEQADIDRRERVKQRNMELNQRLRQVCAEYPFCRFDGEAAFGTAFVPNDVSTRDYFHPSTAGQAKLASVSWDHGYWGPTDSSGQMRETNATPTPTLTHPCTDLTCTFSASSTEAGVTFSWHFGDGRTSSDSSFTHTYAVAGTYEVTLHAIDQYGATASTSRTVTVGEGSSEPTTGTLGGTVGDAGGPISGATVSIDGTAYSTETAGDGSYTIAGLPADDYTVTAAATGYVEKSERVTIRAGEETRLDFTLSAESGEEPPPPTPMWVGDLDDASAAGKGQAWTATVEIHVLAQDGVSVAGAIATGSWSDGSSGSCTIDVTGWCTVQISLNAKKSPSTRFGMQNVVLDGFIYHAERNTDPDSDSDPPGTAITVSP